MKYLLALVYGMCLCIVYTGFGALTHWLIIGDVINIYSASSIGILLAWPMVWFLLTFCICAIGGFLWFIAYSIKDRIKPRIIHKDMFFQNLEEIFSSETKLNNAKNSSGNKNVYPETAGSGNKSTPPKR